VLIGGIVAAVVVVVIVAGAALRRRAQDDVHSVEHYHRQLHTLEEMRTHPTSGREEGNGAASFPASTFRVSTSPTVRMTESASTIVPPVPPPPVANQAKALAFDDSPDGDAHADADVGAEAEANGRPASLPGTFMTGKDDPAMHSINRRPRRLGGSAAAIAAVAVLVAVLVVTGLHSNRPGHKTGNTTGTTSHAATSGPTSHPGAHAGSPTHHATTTTSTTTTAPPTVSAAEAVTANAATYRVADANYSLALGADNGECWISATDTSTGKVLYTGTLFTGQSETVAASGSVTVVAGAPGAFMATVNGAAVVLPPGAQAPFTLTFLPPAGTAAGTTGSTTTTVAGGGTAAGAGANGASSSA
jgi:hypothetical protein